MKTNFENNLEMILHQMVADASEYIAETPLTEDQQAELADSIYEQAEDSLLVLIGEAFEKAGY